MTFSCSWGASRACAREALRAHDHSIQIRVQDKDNVKRARIYPLPDDEGWKVSIIKDLALHQKGHLKIDFDEKELEDILDWICTN